MENEAENKPQKKEKPKLIEPNETEIAQKTWDPFHWAQYGDQLHRRKMAELNTGIYDPRPYETREKIVFWVAIISIILSWVVVAYLIVITQYILAVTSMGISIVATYFMATFYSRIPVHLKAGPSSVELKKEDTR